MSNLGQRMLDALAATQLTTFTIDRISTYALAPDQKQWAIVRGEISSDVVLVSGRR